MNYPGRVIQLGDRGDEVSAIQAKLGVWTTGIYGPTTLANVEKWQEAHGLQPDGLVGPHTWAALFPDSPTPAGASPLGTPFMTCLRWTLRWEGGWANDPADPGGATMRGVTQAVYNHYRAQHGLGTQTVRLIAEAELQDIYRTGYWDECGCAAIPLPLAASVFDLAVNGGPGRAKELLGRVGAGAPRPRALALCQQRLAFYERIIAHNPRLAKFRPGWRNRTLALEAFVQTL